MLEGLALDVKALGSRAPVAVHVIGTPPGRQPAERGFLSANARSLARLHASSVTTDWRVDGARVDRVARLPVGESGHAMAIQANRPLQAFRCVGFAIAD